jgi:hypothetical protein
MENHHKSILGRQQENSREGQQGQDEHGGKKLHRQKHEKDNHILGNQQRPGGKHRFSHICPETPLNPLGKSPVIRHEFACSPPGSKA